MSRARTVFYRALRSLAPELGGTYFAIAPVPDRSAQDGSTGSAAANLYLSTRLESPIVTSIYSITPRRERLAAQIHNDATITEGMESEVERSITDGVLAQRDVIVRAARLHRSLTDLYNSEASANRLRRFLGEAPGESMVAHAFSRARDARYDGSTDSPEVLLEFLSLLSAREPLKAAELRRALTSKRTAAHFDELHATSWENRSAQPHEVHREPITKALVELAEVPFSFARPVQLAEPALGTASTLWSRLEAMDAVDDYLDVGDERNGLTAQAAQVKPPLSVKREAPAERQPRFLDQSVLSRINQRMKGAAAKTRPLYGDPQTIIERAIRASAEPYGVATRGSRVLLALAADRTLILEGVAEPRSPLDVQLLGYFHRQVSARRIAAQRLTARGMDRFLNIRADLLENIAGRGFMLELAGTPIDGYAKALEQLFSAVAALGNDIASIASGLMVTTVMPPEPPKGTDTDTDTDVEPEHVRDPDEADTARRREIARRCIHLAAAAAGDPESVALTFTMELSLGSGSPTQHKLTWELWRYAWHKGSGRKLNELPSFEIAP